MRLAGAAVVQSSRSGKTIWKDARNYGSGMGSVAVPTISSVWQTSAALLVAFVCWFLNTLVAGAYVTVFEPSGLTLWTLAVAGWCGVFFAHKACDALFPHCEQRVVFLMFVVVSAFNPLLGYLNDQTAWEQIGRLAQTLATIATAHALFLHQETALTRSANVS
jgi:hypothetical protein